MIRVVCPFAGPGRPHPATRAALDAYAPHWEAIDVSGDGDAYWRLLRDLWSAAEDVVLVEHDIEITAGVVPAFEACPQPWCVHPYRIPTPPHLRFRTASPVIDLTAPQVLGCVRWRRELITAHPDAVASLPPERRYWSCLDGFLTLSLHDRGVGSPHVHHPGLWHHHPEAFHHHPQADPVRYQGPYADGAGELRAAVAMARVRQVETRVEIEEIADSRRRSGRLDWSPAGPNDLAAIATKGRG
jgi:hypothetical protein